MDSFAEGWREGEGEGGRGEGERVIGSGRRRVKGDKEVGERGRE